MRIVLLTVVSLNLWWTFPFPFFSSSLALPLYLLPVLLLSPFYLFVFPVHGKISKATLCTVCVIVVLLVISILNASVRSTALTVTVFLTFVFYRYHRQDMAESFLFSVSAVSVLHVSLLVLTFVGAFDGVYFSGGLFGWRGGGIFFEPSHAAFTLYLANVFIVSAHQLNLLRVSNNRLFISYGSLLVGFVLCFSSTLTFILMGAMGNYLFSSLIERRGSGWPFRVIAVIAVSMSVLIYLWRTLSERVAAIIYASSDADLSEAMYLELVRLIFNEATWTDIIFPSGLGNVREFFIDVGASTRFLNLAGFDGLSALILLVELGVPLLSLLVLFYVPVYRGRLFLFFLLIVAVSLLRWAGPVNGVWIPLLVFVSLFGSSENAVQRS